MRFWVLGPVQDGDGPEAWGVTDVRDGYEGHRESKPQDFVEFWPTQAEAQAHADALNTRDSFLHPGAH